jgi:hypothetical protein
LQPPGIAVFVSTLMTIQDQEVIEVVTPTGPMRTYRFYPKTATLRPAIILYSEIFQVTGPIRRLAARMAGEGFEVLVPEVYHEYEALGQVLAYDQAGADRGNFLKYEKPLAAYDGDNRALIDWIFARPYPWRSARGGGGLLLRHGAAHRNAGPGQERRHASAGEGGQGRISPDLGAAGSACAAGGIEIDSRRARFRRGEF